MNNPLHTGPRVTNNLPLQIEPVKVAELAAAVDAGQETFYVLLDACDEPRIPPQVAQLEDRAVSLYRGSAEEDFWAIAPYLSQLDRNLLDWITAELEFSPWGYVLSAPLDLEALRKHLRRFLTVIGPEGETLYFRFYDPRVVQPFLESCDPEERAQFLGPITNFWLPDPAGTFTHIHFKKSTPSNQ